MFFWRCGRKLINIPLVLEEILLGSVHDSTQADHRHHHQQDSGSVWNSGNEGQQWFFMIQFEFASVLVGWKSQQQSDSVAARTVHFSSISVYMGQGGSGAGSHGVAYGRTTKVETEMKNQEGAWLKKWDAQEWQTSLV